MRFDDVTNQKQQLIAYWREKPQNRPVKIVAVVNEGRQSIAKREHKKDVGGYFTSFGWVSGRTPEEVESILGLRLRQLIGGAYLYVFQRLPEMDEFDLDRWGYSQCIDGISTSDASPALQEKRKKSLDDGYRIGKGASQWRVRTGAYIPAVGKPYGPKERFPTLAEWRSSIRALE